MKRFFCILGVYYLSMGTKKQRQKKSHFPSLPIPALPEISLPSPIQRSIWAVALFTISLIFIFSLFDNAGRAGILLKNFTFFVFGQAAPFVPLIFFMGGVVLFSLKGESSKPVFFAILLAFLGLSGMLGIFAYGANNEIMREIGGWLGFLVAKPLFSAFGLWVSEIIFVALFLVSLIIFWQLIPHGQGEEGDFSQKAQEKIKKIFAPHFEVKEIESEPRIQNTTVIDSGEGSLKDKQKSSKEEKGKLSEQFGGIEYQLPPIDLLENEKGSPNAGDIKVYSAIIKKTLQNFGISVEMSEVNIGPAVTQYAFKPAEGVKLSKITALRNDLSLAVAAHPIRIEAPIPGRALVGIEIPNKTRAVVRLRSLLENTQFSSIPASLPLALGKDVAGSPIFTDLARMPHLLVAGATGSGKTIGLNNIILSLIFRNSPEILRFVLVDPKRVEFPVYNDLPHLLTPVIFDTQRTLNVLKWLIKEMERRFLVLSNAKARDIKGYHALLSQHNNQKDDSDWESMPYIVTVIDELADLMAARGRELEAMIVRLAQMARAVGIHLVLATQRPSVEVITGLIKANITSRIAFQVASQVDSRTILDASGAEQLLGQGDMLFSSAELSKPRRVQGAYVSEREVKKVVSWIRGQVADLPREEISEDDLTQSAMQGLELPSGMSDEDDSLYEEAKRVVVESGKASASLLQRRLKLGYARAARLIDMLEDRGIIGPGEGAKPREVYAKHEQTGEGQQEWETPKL